MSKEVKRFQWKNAKEERTRLMRKQEIRFARTSSHGRRFSPNVKVKGKQSRGFDFTQLPNFEKQKRLIKKAIILSRQIAEKEGKKVE